MTALFDELAWKAQDEETASARDEFKFDRFLLLSRAWTDAGPEPGSEAGPSKAGAGGKKRAKREGGGGGGAGAGAAPVLVYVRPEDQVFSSVAEWSATFKVEKDQTGDRDMRPVRVVMLVDAKKVPAARKAIEAAIATF